MVSVVGSCSGAASCLGGQSGRSPWPWGEWDVRRLGVERGAPTVEVVAENDGGTRVQRPGVRVVGLVEVARGGGSGPGKVCLIGG